MRMHVSSSIRGMLNWDRRYTRRMLNTITDNAGKPYESIEQFRDDLMDLLKQGHELIPSTGCDNFDPVKGCLGHPDAEGASAR